MIAPAADIPRRAAVLPVVLGLLAVPLLLAAGEAWTFHAANRPDGIIVSGGLQREYRLHVPHTYDRSKPAPLVISMHGAGLWGAAQEEMSQWDEVADREGVIVAYPSASPEGGLRTWRVEHDAGLRRDVRFIADMIDTLSARYNIDAARIYADGLSNGGGMAFVLSCTLSDRIAAVGLVASAQTLEWGWCTDRRPVPMIAFHGTDDPVVPYRGGAMWISRTVFPSIPQWVSSWARRNGCSPSPAESAVAVDVVRRAYGSCANDADVELYTVLGGGHAWPGGGALPESWLGRTTHGIDATATMWAFFRAHPLVREAVP